MGGTELWLTLKESLNDPDPGLAQKTIGSGISVLTATTARFTLDPADTETIPDTVHQVYYDIQLKEGGSGQVSTPIDGTVVIKPDVTRTRT